ncbi:MAG: peptidoglycan-binding protein [Christensenellaceae bacterium]|nr:peptidoglycan-binding protein [Christensenellaceae bacterium]
MFKKTRFLALLVLIIFLQTSVSHAAYATLRYGDSGEDVKSLQQKLVSLGFNTNGIDGKYGNGTKKAVYNFQRATGLYKDGIAGNATLTKLYGANNNSKPPVAEGTVDYQNVSITPGSQASNNLPTVVTLPSETLEYGSVNSSVKDMQLALNSLGFNTNGADGKFGRGTEKAVKAFQNKNKLKVDGKAGRQTLNLLYKLCGIKISSAPTAPNTNVNNTTPDTNTAITSYTPVGTLRIGSSGNNVKLLQLALKQLGFYSGSINSKYDKNTSNAVLALQKKYNLDADGVAGAMTQRLIQKLIAGENPNTNTNTNVTSPVTLSFAPPTNKQVQLLHWFNDVKGKLKYGNTLNVYEPVSGAGWKLKVVARGSHCDAEPLTATDTQELFRAFGGKETWTPKAVYVQLPDGRWTIAATHNVAHGGQSIKDNNFNGHLCVHFLRDMEETKKNDPNYGVTNQNTIRKAYKKLTGNEYQESK